MFTIFIILQYIVSSVESHFMVVPKKPNIPEPNSPPFEREFFAIPIFFLYILYGGCIWYNPVQPSDIGYYCNVWLRRLVLLNKSFQKQKERTWMGLLLHTLLHTLYAFWDGSAMVALRAPGAAKSGPSVTPVPPGREMSGILSYDYVYQDVLLSDHMD